MYNCEYKLKPKNNLISLVYTLLGKFGNTEPVKVLNDRLNELLAGWRVASLPFRAGTNAGMRERTSRTYEQCTRSTSEPVLCTLHSKPIFNIAGKKCAEYVVGTLAALF